MRLPSLPDLTQMSADDQKKALKKMAYEGLFSVLTDGDLRLRYPNVYMRAIEVALDRTEGTAPTKVQHSFEEAPWLAVVRKSGRTVDGRRFDDAIDVNATPVQDDDGDEVIIVWGTAS